ncbi:protein DEK [Girardinichthys multiradiatus]|uniref:protein DEK n=1 Tax=Girardinichthys multiradiatus TaxID=208333 RepID=UPI001FAC3DFE|nr:protein DEK [Girardinichthys multiradiatus]
MGDVVEEAMDSSAVSEEEVGDLQRGESIPRRSCSKISDVGEIIEGKRAKKTVERLDFQAPKVKEKLKIAVGRGDKLGDIPRTNYEINKRKADELKLLHSILFDRPGKSASVKKNLRLFNGFPFDADSLEFTKKREKMLRNSNLNNTKLKLICTVLDLEKKGTHLDLIDRILNFLIAPKNSGKRAPVKKKRRSKKKLSGNDSKAKSKPKAKTSSSSSKKSKAGSKSKAIVMDSSSDEEDEEKMGTSVEAEGSDGEEKPSEQDGEQEEQSDKSEESEEEELEESDESSKPKSSRGKKKKNATEKRQRTPAKKTGRPKKRAINHRSDESDGDSDSEEKPKKKRVAAAKTKKADSSSSSNKNTTNAAEDSSDDDEPLIRIIKKAPTDDQLKKIVENLLKEANLEEMTMKQICQKVFDTYPEHDLSGRKDFIKQTVKTFIT